MKATLQTEVKKTPADAVMLRQVDNVENGKMSSRRIFLFSVLGLTTVVVIVAIMLTSLYFGAILLQNKDYYGDTSTPRGIHNEEAVKDNLTPVRDNKTKLAVYMFPGQDVCYVTVVPYNESDKSKMPSFHLNDSFVFKPTTEIVLRMSVLSDQSQKLCEGKQLLWVHQMNEKEWAYRSRQKRSACCTGKCYLWCGSCCSR